MSEVLRNIDLTDDELLGLDGRVNTKAQAVIDRVKLERSFGEFPLPVFGKVLAASSGTGKLTWTFKSIRSCPYCNKKYSYWAYPRSGRYHRKGDTNFSKPKKYAGVAFNEGFITIAGHGDLCRACEEKHEVIGTLVKYVIDNDLKIELPTWSKVPTRWKKDEQRKCFKCKATMYESEMGKHPTMMGNGSYPAICPRCKAKSLPIFGPPHGSTGRHRMIPAAQHPKQEAGK